MQSKDLLSEFCW